MKLAEKVSPGQADQEQTCAEKHKTYSEPNRRGPTVPAFLIIKTLSGPRVSQFDPFAHFLKLFSFLLLIHVSSLSSYLFDWSEAKIININRLRKHSNNDA